MTLLLLCCALRCHASSNSSAHYSVLTSVEGQTPPVVDVWISSEPGNAAPPGGPGWWRMTLRKADGSLLGVRALSERTPMRSQDGVGRIARYQLNVNGSEALEYMDQTTGSALLPELMFRDALLPNPASDARYARGFATTGELLGHILQLSDGPVEPALDFAHARTLKLRTDLWIGTSRDTRDDGRPRKNPGDDYTYIPLTKSDIERAIASGFNYFNAIAGLSEWLLAQPVFVRGVKVYPDDLYRSNVTTSTMFIDEPMVRLGWSGGDVESVLGPQVVAQALRMRVEALQPLSRRVIQFRDASVGSLTWIRPKAPSWETEFWSAWYQMQAGAPGVVHEGRYSHRGYGWDPEILLGEGVPALTDNDMFSFYYAFLRGAARAFDGYWGTSIYGQSEPALRLPALIRAYNMGAKHLWFWSSDHDHHVPFEEQLRLAESISRYAASHPRGPGKPLPLKAREAIVLPEGYAFNCSGVWGTQREERNAYGVAYGDIAAAALFQGILASRSGIEYDYVVNSPDLSRLHYKKLVFINENGSVTSKPPSDSGSASPSFKLAPRR
ncbi:MAG: hypothetical protein IT209_07515 [Armatimonadetes bacterium]|nr:hypothetical protein [Armatimonadota bacterium]